MQDALLGIYLLRKSWSGKNSFKLINLKVQGISIGSVRNSSFEIPNLARYPLPSSHD